MLKKYWKQLPSQKELQELFIYEPSTGNLIRRENLKHGGGKGYKKGDIVGCTGKRNGYVNVKMKGNVYLAHRLIWVYVYGDIDINMEIDHINRNRSDNRSSNLRLIPRFINLRNKNLYKNNTTGVAGVSAIKTKNNQERWLVNITIQVEGKRKLIHLGTFTSFEQAKTARKQAEEKYWK